MVYPRFSSIREFPSVREWSQWGHVSIFGFFFLAMDVDSIQGHKKSD